jgi:murein DD-endopeptidase MepM/ murein hydrolase activator NlpD
VRLEWFSAVLVLAFAFGPVDATAAGDARVAAVQVALHQRGLYHGTIDGVDGPATRRAVMRLQRRKRLPADGIVGPQTLSALGGFAPLGLRVVTLGTKGLDVAALQFELAWHGFPSSRFDGTFGLRMEAAVRGFQRWSGLPPDGLPGPATVAALRRPLPISPISLAYPVAAQLGDRFGPRGTRFHAGVDLLAAAGTPVTAAAAGDVTWAARRDGWGNLVAVAHGHGVRTLYAHLARIEVRLGQHVSAGAEVGRVGATGDATGPHLHFEVRLRGAAVDPLTALR